MHNGKTDRKYLVTLALMASLAVAAVYSKSGMQSGPQAAFTCQNGNRLAACIPIKKANGTLVMASVNPNGTLGDDLDIGDRLFILKPGMELVEPEWRVYVKSSRRAEFNLHGNETIPVLMADGTLALVTGKGDHLSASGIRRIAPSANPTQPQLIVDAAVAAAR